MGYSYIIEHMEADDHTPKALPEWVELEYKHMLALAGKDSTVHFTHLSDSSARSLLSSLNASSDPSTAKGAAHTDDILSWLKSQSISIDQVCLLDPKATSALTPEDGNGVFSCFLFGGILGDDPPRDRTSELRVLGFPTRHLGSIQMTTDTALGVTKKVVDDKVPLDKIPYIDYPTITFSANESVEMPFRYMATGDNKPLLPPGMKDHLKKDLDQSFEF
ncbi:DUF431-domain-containing protein [Punctularia strigosozonata HHB-11173 SS5]|uniref:DUF431-domain-containing protein n=1 Tax=Punctularia strigosozonata (strain HHB-11173) TaxID=741275 RepID=UPI00044183E2|nr:DUF431-domain-containing protein [Punctularia strigosozonata HHB-11173 SS5]EIN11578.1 DUF431-domain-containing protein [Punctularia strigosozonata HHB-11173 SS5]